MRKPRAIIFDDEVHVLNVLADLLRFRGYDVLALNEPISACPFDHHKTSQCLSPCADVIITDFQMPRMNGIELLRRQSLRGCVMDNRNKAMISGYMDSARREELEMMKYTFFPKPFPIQRLNDWLASCEKRIDLSLPLASRRREPRKPINQQITYVLKDSETALTAIAENVSSAGLRLRLHNRIAEGDHVRITTELPLVSQNASVRWVKKQQDDTYVAGLMCC